MKKWEIFEQESAQYIDKNYSSKFNIKVVTVGGSDSTLNDINIYKNNNLILNLEVKSSKSQSGQFVVSLDPDGVFQYGQNNFSPSNTYVELILSELNSSEGYLAGVGENVTVDISESTSLNWIKDYYKSKGVSFFISEHNGKKIIIDINNLDQYFSVSCVLRPKKSGSSDVSKIRSSIFYQGMKQKYPQYNITENNLVYQDRKLYINTSKNLFGGVKHKETFIVNGNPYRFQIEKKGENLFYVRNLSATNNTTVIFTIQTILQQQEIDLINFESALKKY